MTFWQTEHWKAYERAYGSTVSRVDELAAATWQTHVVDLTPPEDVLWTNIPKTMKQAIKKGERHTIITEPKAHVFAAYRMAHGESTNWCRPEATYLCQAEIFSAGHALIVAALTHNDAALAGCYVCRWNGWAYYWSGQSLEPHVMPALIWRAMRECKALGDTRFELGWIKQDTEKERSISAFKLRWGGQNLPANYLAMEAACEQSA